MKLTAEEVDTLKVNIEGGCLENLYKRLKWGTSKTVRLSFEEKEVLLGMIDGPYMRDKDNLLFKKILNIKE